MMFLSRLFGGGRAEKRVAGEMLKQISGQARNPLFFSDEGVEDTMDGRFEMMTLHSSLIMDRLKEIGRPAFPLAHALHKQLFSNFDYALRETVASDHTIARKMRELAESYVGRDRAYTAALELGLTDVREALARNFADVARSEKFLDGLAEYTVQARKQLDEQSPDALLQGHIEWPSPQDYVG